MTCHWQHYGNHYHSHRHHKGSYTLRLTVNIIMNITTALIIFLIDNISTCWYEALWLSLYPAPLQELCVLARCDQLQVDLVMAVMVKIEMIRMIMLVMMITHQWEWSVYICRSEGRGDLLSIKVIVLSEVVPCRNMLITMIKLIINIIVILMKVISIITNINIIIDISTQSKSMFRP